jgi:hypothetical protein
MGSIDEKARCQKSHATVPLILINLGLGRFLKKFAIFDAKNMNFTNIEL